jgi:hypothetical protein
MILLGCGGFLLSVSTVVLALESSALAVLTGLAAAALYLAAAHAAKGFER